MVLFSALNTDSLRLPKFTKVFICPIYGVAFLLTYYIILARSVCVCVWLRPGDDQLLNMSVF